MTFKQTKKALEDKGYIVDSISKNDNVDMDIYVKLRKKDQVEKFNVLVELENGWTIEDIIDCHKYLYESEDYKQLNSEEWEEE